MIGPSPWGKPSAIWGTSREHPTVGRAPQVGIGTKLSDTPGRVRSPAPLPGQHTDELLSSLGYNADEIAGLREKGAVA